MTLAAMEIAKAERSVGVSVSAKRPLARSKDLIGMRTAGATGEG